MLLSAALPSVREAPWTHTGEALRTSFSEFLPKRGSLAHRSTWPWPGSRGTQNHPSSAALSSEAPQFPPVRWTWVCGVWDPSSPSLCSSFPFFLCLTNFNLISLYRYICNYIWPHKCDICFLSAMLCFFTLPDFTSLDFLFLMASLLSTDPAKDVITISGASSHFLLWAHVAKCICVATHMCTHTEH